VCNSYAFLRLERSLLRWRRKANSWHATDSLERTRFSCWCLYNHKGCTYRAPVQYVTKTWSVVLLNKKYIYCYLKCIVYDTLLKPGQSFWITLYFSIFTCYGRLRVPHQEKQLCIVDTWYLLFCVDDCLVCRVEWKIDKYIKNKLCTKLALFTRLYRDARLTKHNLKPISVSNYTVHTM